MSLIKILQQFCDKLLSPDVPVDKKYRTLKAIREMEVSEEDIRVTKLGKIVKKCTKLDGKPGKLAENIIKDWKEMIYKNNNNIEFKKKNIESDITKTTKFQQPSKNNQKNYQKTSSDSQSESSEENENKNQHIKSKPIEIQSKKHRSTYINSEISNNSSNNSSDEENYKTMKTNNKRSISNSGDEMEIPVKHFKINKPSKQQEIHKNNRKVEITKIRKVVNSNSSDNNSDNGDDSSDSNRFIEMLSKNHNKSQKNSCKEPVKYSSDEDEYSDNQYESLKKNEIPKKQPIIETKYKSDESSDSDEAYINYLESANAQIKNNKTNHSKPTIVPLEFLAPINDNKTQKKVLNNETIKKEPNNEMKKPIDSKTLNNNNSIKTELNKQHKSRKSEIKSGPSFEDFLKGSALNKAPIETNPRKRKSEFVPLHQTDSKKKNTTTASTFTPGDLSNCPVLTSSSLSNSDMDEQSVYNRTDIIFQKKNQNNHINEKAKDDVDCTTKYSSERKIWTPKSRNDGIKPELLEENLRTINGVLETEIAQYSYEKLLAFDADNKKIQRKTETFWEKLFKKNHKSANRRDGETWRDAYLRNQRDQDIRLKQISERLKKTTEENANAVTKAKLLTNSGGHFAKPKRRMTDMRR